MFEIFQSKILEMLHINTRKPRTYMLSTGKKKMAKNINLNVRTCLVPKANHTNLILMTVTTCLYATIMLIACYLNLHQNTCRGYPGAGGSHL
jgi:2-methylaconitate cis-trans-isomerase PrpF